MAKAPRQPRQPRKPRAPRKPRVAPPPLQFHVIVDNDEKKPWLFPPCEAEGCIGSTIQSMDTGDYTLVGYESVLCIERKGTTGEVAQNVTQARFERELERMRQFPVRAVILEFTLRELLQFPDNSGIPQNRRRFIRTTPQFLLKRILELQHTYDVPFIFAGRDGRVAALSLFSRVLLGELPPKPNPPKGQPGAAAQMKDDKPCRNDTPAP